MFPLEAFQVKTNIPVWFNGVPSPDNMIPRFPPIEPKTGESVSPCGNPQTIPNITIKSFNMYCFLIWEIRAKKLEKEKRGIRGWTGDTLAFLFNAQKRLRGLRFHAGERDTRAPYPFACLMKNSRRNEFASAYKKTWLTISSRLLFWIKKRHLVAVCQV